MLIRFFSLCLTLLPDYGTLKHYERCQFTISTSKAWKKWDSQNNNDAKNILAKNHDRQSWRNRYNLRRKVAIKFNDFRFEARKIKILTFPSIRLKDDWNEIFLPVSQASRVKIFRFITVRKSKSRWASKIAIIPDSKGFFKNLYFDGLKMVNEFHTL